MSDALGSNRPSTGHLMHHGRRQFVSVFSQFPEEVEWVLERYGQIWRIESECINLSAAQRLQHHQAHSFLLMMSIYNWGVDKLSNGEIEEVSGLGKAVRYFIKHFGGLTAFCRVEGAMLDNNDVERALKLVVRDRKNAMFYKTVSGAKVADVVMSLIATCAENNVNVFEYFNQCQRESHLVSDYPERYLPWVWNEGK